MKIHVCVLGEMISTQQYKKLMKSYQKDSNVSAASLKSGMDRKTARRYLQGKSLPPGEPRKERHWRTHEDAFVAVWAEVEGGPRGAAVLELGTRAGVLQRVICIA